MKKITHTIITFFALFLGSITAFAQQMPDIPSDPDVRFGKLDNGLTYYIRKNNKPEERLNFYIAQKVGSILEEDNQRGLAHFLEHMCFNGTQHFPGNSLVSYLESIGVKFGVNLNAYTSIDETVYRINNVPSKKEGAVDSCLYILRDWADGLLLDPKEIDKERGVIHEEWRTRQSPMMRMYERSFPIIYPNSKYAYRLPIGTMEVVDKFPYQMLRDYYEKWYRPDQQGIIIVGDCDLNQMEAKVKEIFSQIQMPKNPAERVYFPVPDNKEPLVSIEKDKEQTSPVIYVFNKHDVVPSEQKKNMDYMALNYMKSMIGNMLYMRLKELTEKPNPPFVYAAAEDDNFFLSKTKDAFTSLVVAKEDDIETAFISLMREVERARRFGFTPTEYERAKADYLVSLESQYKEREKTESDNFAQQYIRNFIDSEPIPSIEQEYTIMNQIAPAVKVDMVNQVMQSLISDSNLVICMFLPDKEGIKYPTKETVLADYKRVMDEKITPYEDKVSNEPLISTLPKAGKVVKTEKGPFDTTILTLSNGVKTIVKTTDFKADEIQMAAFSPGGTSLYPDSEILDLKMLNSVSDLGGLGNFSKIDLSKALAGKIASVNASVGGITEGVSGSCTPKDLETMLQLTYLSFTAPRMDKDAFEAFKTKMKAQLKNAEANPMKALQDTMTTTLYGNHPRSLIIKTDMIDNINYDRIMQIYKDRFANAGDFTFVFVGNIDLAKAVPLFEQYLGSLPNINRAETWKDRNMDIRKGKINKVFQKDMETKKTSVFAVYTGNVKYTLKNQIMMSMVNQILNIVYVETVREKEGGTYGVSVSANLVKYPKERGVMQIYFDTDPTRRAKMTDVVNGEIDKFISKGPSAENLAKVKEYMLKSLNENVKKNGYWNGVIQDYYWENIDDYTDYEIIVNSITAADLQKFAKDFFSQNNRIGITMTDDR